LRQPITLQRFTQGNPLEQPVRSVKVIVDHDNVMYTGSLCKLNFLDSSVQAFGDGILSLRSTSGETLMESSEARRCDEEVGGFYRCLLDKADSLVAGQYSKFQTVVRSTPHLGIDIENRAASGTLNIG